MGKTKTRVKPGVAASDRRWLFFGRELVEPRWGQYLRKILKVWWISGPRSHKICGTTREGSEGSSYLHTYTVAPLFISWKKDLELRKNVGLACSRMTHLFVWIFFYTNPEEGQAVGMVQAKKLFVDAFFFFVRTNIRLFWSN